MLQPYSRVLVVDDSATSRKIIRSLLYKIGFYNIREATDGRHALAIMRTEPFDLVISDWEMGPIDGLALLVTMRRCEEWRHMPFIMVTASASHKFQEVARDHGATHYLKKPFSADMLRDRIATFGAVAAA